MADKVAVPTPKRLVFCEPLLSGCPKHEPHPDTTIIKFEPLAQFFWLSLV